MPHVFMSYKSEDREFAFEVDRKIRDAGFETWIDQARLTGGDDWREEINEALRNSFAMVLIVSPETMRSKYIMYEMAFGWALGLRVIPITIHGADHEDFHPRLKGRHKRDFSAIHPWPELIADLTRASASVRDNEYLIPRAAPPAVTHAAHELSGIDFERRELAIEALMANDHPAARQVLLNRLTDHQPATRFQIAFALAENKETQALGPILEALYCGDMNWQYGAIRAIRRMGPNVVDALHDALKHEAPEIRCEAVQTLGQADFLQPTSIPFLGESLKDSDQRVRFAAAQSLGAFEHLAPIPELIAALSHPDTNVRTIVTEALGKSKNPRAIQPLANVLKPAPKTKRDTNEIIAAVTALRRIGTPEALEAVEPYRGISWYWVDLGDEPK